MSIALQILGLIDLTSLNDDDNEDKIIKLCNIAHTTYGDVAAICIYSRFIPVAKVALHQSRLNIPIATVVNFPHGSSDIELALYEIQLAIARGADEIDLVFPYHYFKNGNFKVCHTMLNQAKQICGDKLLKVILETGELKTAELITKASQISIECGADFIKTSTGKVAVNATLTAAEVMLNVIHASGGGCGFKASGGIRTVIEALQYVDLATKIMGQDWVSPKTFRLGASALLNDVLLNLK